MTVENVPFHPDHHSVLTSTEREVAAIWCEILQLGTSLHPTDNFFSLGGDSLAMTMVLFRVGEALGVELPAAALLETPELRGFCALVDSTRFSGDHRSESRLL